MFNNCCSFKLFSEKDTVTKLPFSFTNQCQLIPSETSPSPHNFILYYTHIIIGENVLRWALKAFTESGYNWTSLQVSSFDFHSSSFAFRPFLVEHSSAPKPQKCISGCVRMDQPERLHLLSHLMVPNEQQVSMRILQTIAFYTPYSLRQLRGCSLSASPCLVSSSTSSRSAYKCHPGVNHLPPFVQEVERSVAEFTSYTDLCQSYYEDVISKIVQVSKDNASSEEICLGLKCST